MSKALELAKFGREAAPTGLVVGDSDAQTLSSKTFSDGPVFSAGAANAVPYLNASKVFSTLSTFVFDGTNLGLGTATPGAKFHNTGQSYLIGRVYTEGAFASYGGQFWTTSAAVPMILGINEQEKARIHTNGNFGIGTDAPVAKLDIVSGTNTTLSVPTGAIAKFSGSIVLNSLNTGGAGDLDSIYFQKSHGSGINIANYNVGIIRSYTSNGYMGGLDFYTNKLTGPGSYTTTFAMRIDENQNLGVGNTVQSNVNYQFGTTTTDGFGNIPDCTIQKRLGVAANNTSPVISLAYYSSAYGMDLWTGTTGLSPGYIDIRNNEALIFRKNTYTGTATETMRITSTGNLTVGSSSSYGKIGAVQAGKGTIAGLDTTSYAAGVGATLDLGGNYRASNDYSTFVRIAAEKANATNGDYGYNMGFYVTTNNGATMGTKAMTVYSTGYVGIGTETPGARLHVRGDSNSSFNDSAINVYNGTSGGGLVISAANSGNQIGGFAGSVIQAYGPNNGTTPSLMIGTDYSSPIVFSSYYSGTTSYTERVRINGSNGNVGIGTTNPITKLTVNGDANMSGYGTGASYRLYFGNEVTSGPGKGIFLEDYYLKIQGHRNEGVRIQGVNAAGAVEAFATFYGDANSANGIWFNKGLVVQNGVATYMIPLDGLGNGTAYDFDVVVGDESGQGNIIEVHAMYDHYYDGYGAGRIALIAKRQTSIKTYDVWNYSTGNGGSWTFSCPNSSTLRITKTAGSYVGSGYGHIMVRWRKF